MNKLRGRISAIQSADSVSIVDIQVDGTPFSCIVLETPETTGYLRTGNEVFLLFKESVVSLGKNISGELSLRNRIKGRVESVEHGAILTRVLLDFRGKRLTSLITSRSADTLRIQPGDSLEMFIKASDVTLMEVSDE